MSKKWWFYMVFVDFLTTDKKITAFLQMWGGSIHVCHTYPISASNSAILTVWKKLPSAARLRCIFPCTVWQYEAISVISSFKAHFFIRFSRRNRTETRYSSIGFPIEDEFTNILRGRVHRSDDRRPHFLIVKFEYFFYFQTRQTNIFYFVIVLELYSYAR